MPVTWIRLFSLAFLVAGVGVFGAGFAVQPPPGPNILLVTIDTLRADHLSVYGYPRSTDPTLKRLASEGLTFLDVTAPVPLTLPSHISLLTGVYPVTHGIRDNGMVWRGDSPTLAEILSKTGYDTAAWVSSFVLSARFGLSRGFSFYEDNVTEEGKADSYHLERSADATIARVREWFSQRKDGTPFFVWVHLFDPHMPYDPPEPYRSRFGSLYDGEIASADRALGTLFEELRSKGLWDSTLVVVTSDHGEGLGDHGENTHGYFVYQSTLRVPLIVKLPGRVLSGRKIERPVHLVDIAPSLVRVSGQRPPGVMQGEVLPEFFQRPGTGGASRTDQRVLYAESYYFQLQFNWAPFRVYRQGPWKLIAAPRSELFNLRDDPAELRDVAASNQALVRSFEERLRSLEERYRTSNVDRRASSSVPDPEVVEKLRSLGYSTVGPSIQYLSPAPDLPDPKDRLGVFQRVKASEPLMQSDPPAAIRQLREVLELDPDLVRARELLALTLESERRWDEASVEYRMLLERIPNSPRLYSRLAVICGKQGKAGEGLEFLEKALQLEPDNHLLFFEQGQLRVQMGDLPAARDSFERVVELEPGAKSAHYSLGQVLIREERPQDALAHFRTATEIDPTYKEAFNNLGLCLVLLGQKEQAVEAWQKALTIDPAYENARRNLIQGLLDLGREEEANRQQELLKRPVPARPRADGR